MRLLSALAVWALACATPLAAHETPSPFRAALDQQQATDQRLLDIAWRLRTANADNCEDAAPAIGVMLLDVANYSSSGDVAEALALPGPVAVQAAAKGSPAASAGMLARTPILAIGETAIAELPADPSGDYARLLRLYEMIAEDLTADQSVGFTLGPSNSRREVRVEGVSACPGRIEVRSGSDRASSDSARVFIGSEFPGLAYSDEELAAALAHEFAHVWLNHNPLLDARGRTRANIREAEREADRLAVWILAHAGYPTDAAPRFMRRWGPRHSGGLFRKREHDHWRARTKLMEGEMVRLAHAILVGDDADWSEMFVRDFSAPREGD